MKPRLEIDIPGREFINKLAREFGLKDKEKDESIILMNGSEKQFEITKMYSQTGFPDDENSLGFKISVYQETINKEFDEYLVNFDYFVKRLR